MVERCDHLDAAPVMGVARRGGGVQRPAVADRFLTNNRAGFAKTIAEIAITYPDELPQAA